MNRIAGKRFRLMIGAAIVAAATLAGTPAATSANPPAASTRKAWVCDVDRTCVYSGANGTGRRLQMSTGAYDLGGVGDGSLNDHVLSNWNRTDSNWCIYPDAGYEGDPQVYPPGYRGGTGAMSSRASSVSYG